MQKITSIHLNGKSYQLEEAGYEALRAYLSGADAQLNDNPDKAEIIADLELAVAEKCNAFLSPTKDVVTTREISQIIEQMGPVDGPEAVKDEKKKEDASEPARTSKRLYLIHEGAWFAGVCAGLAAYFNIDITVMRIIFVVLTLVTGGAMILVYLALMLFAPYATTSEERAEAYGLPFNAQEVINRAKESYAQFADKREWHSEWHKRRAEWSRQIHEWKRNHRHGAPPARPSTPGMQMPPMHPMRLSPIFGIFTGLFAIVWVAALVSLISTGAIFGWMVPGHIPLWGALLALFVVYHAITGPLKATRYTASYGWGHDHRFAFAETLEVIFFFICAWFLYDHYPAVQSFVNDIPRQFQVFVNELRS